jgi:hypothetical protein
MTSARWATGVALLLTALVAAGVFLARTPAEVESTLRPLRAKASLSDRIVVFGDTVHARVDVSVDLRHVDPDAVKVRAAFAPWRLVGSARVTRKDAGSSSHVQVSYVLRCLTPLCVPERESRPFDFKPARVEFVNRAGGRGLIRVKWPRLTLNTRFAAGDLANAAPWRLDVANVPDATYRASPNLLLALLAGGSLLLLAGGGALAYVGWPRRESQPEPEPEPEPELLPTPLEQALELLEDATRANGAADQRRSLELVAEVLGERGEGDDLARAARALAWSPTAPRLDDTKQLAVRVRETLEHELRQLEEERLRTEESRARTD